MGEPIEFYKLSAKDQNANGIFLKKPKIIGLVENDGAELKASVRMKYFRYPINQQYPLDLNAGFEDYKSRPDEYYTNKLNKVMHFIMSDKDHGDHIDRDEENRAGHSGTDTIDELRPHQVVTHRGALSVLMTTPYQAGGRFRQQWRLCATRYKNKLYLTKVDKSLSTTPESSHHFKFGQYCFSDDPNRRTDTRAPINEIEQMYGIYQSRLQNFQLIYSAEINGIKSQKKINYLNDFTILNKCCFVHTKIIRNSVKCWWNHHKVLRWWVKAYLEAVDDIYVGIKSDDGLVQDSTKVKHLTVHQLPVKKKWSPKVCVQFLYTFLTKVIEEMNGINCPYTTYEFSFDSLSNCITLKMHEGKTEHSFLTDKFVEYLRKT